MPVLWFDYRNSILVSAPLAMSLLPSPLSSVVRIRLIKVKSGGQFKCTERTRAQKNSVCSAWATLCAWLHTCWEMRFHSRSVEHFLTWWLVMDSLGDLLWCLKMRLIQISASWPILPLGSEWDIFKNTWQILLENNAFSSFWLVFYCRLPIKISVYVGFCQNTK